jgi:hypothetical protein
MFLFLVPKDSTRIQYFNKTLNSNEVLAFPDGPVQVKSFYIPQFCTGDKIVDLQVSTSPQQAQKVNIRFLQDRVLFNSNIVSKAELCSSKEPIRIGDISVWSTNKGLSIRFKEKSISAILANEYLRILIEGSLYQNSKIRSTIGDLVGWTAVVFLLLLFGFQLAGHGRTFLRNAQTLTIPCLVFVYWAFWGPSIYDEGWVLATGKSFNEIGWFSNVYSNSSAPMPLGAVFNYISYLITLTEYPLLLARTAWLALVLIALIQLQIILNQLFPETRDKVKLVLFMAFAIYLVAFGGGWRPEILLLVVFNALVIHLIVDNKLDILLVGSLIGFSLSTAQSGLIFLAPIVYLFHRKKITLLQACKILFTAMIVFLLLSISFASFTQILAGVQEFRSSSSHSNLPIIGEVSRYGPLIFGTQSILVTIAFLFLIGATLSILSFFNSKKSETTFFQYNLMCSLIFLTLTPSKWWWHLLPLASLVMLNILELKKVLIFRKVNAKSQLILIPILILCIHLLVKSLVSNRPFSSAYPFNTFSIPDSVIPFVSFTLVVLAVLGLVHGQDQPNIRKVGKSKLIAPTTYGFTALLLVLSLPVIENELFSEERVSNLFQSRTEPECRTLAGLKTLDLTSGKIQANEIMFGRNSSKSPKEFVLETTKVGDQLKGKKLYFSVRAPNGATVSLTDQSGIPYPVSDLTLPGREWSSSKLDDASLRQYFSATSTIIENLSIFASPYSQIVSFSSREVLPKNLRLVVSSIGSVSFSAINSASLVDLTTISDQEPTFVIPPLVTHFGCISNNLFTNSKILSNVNIIQDSGNWFRYSDENTFKSMGINLKTALLPIYGTDRPGLFSILRIDSFDTHLNGG